MAIKKSYLKWFSFQKKREPFFLEPIIGFRPQNEQVFLEAFTHKSIGQKDKKGRYINNERLEFLGDSILSAVVSDYLYQCYPDQQEGFLSISRSKLVKREMLNKIGKMLNLKDYMQNNSQLNGFDFYGNVFEALLGALYIEGGYDCCYQFITNRIFGELINVEKALRKSKDYKSQLMEWSQQNNVSIRFDTQQCSTHTECENKFLFHSFLYIQNEFVAEAYAHNKRSAQQIVARSALKDIHRGIVKIK